MSRRDVGSDAWPMAVQLLQLAAQLTEGIDEGVLRRGFEGVRPSHGFAFACIAGGSATTSDLGEFLGITKQSASQLVAQLVGLGYVVRVAHPRDARARLLALTDRGWACTRAAEAAAADVLDGWRQALPAVEFDGLRSVLDTLSVPGRLRPAW